MSRLLEIMKSHPLTLIVNLPKNDVEMAKAACDAGADALVISHSENDKEIINSVLVPVGLDLPRNKAKELVPLLASDFDFMNFYPEMLEYNINPGKAKIVVLDESYSLDKLMTVSKEKIDAINAAIIPVRQTGKDLVVGDLQNYIAMAMSSNLPVIVPTQRSIKISEVSIIWDTGARGLLLTEVVLGASLKSMVKAIKEYRIAIDDISVDEDSITAS
ncbi:hypothetical protein A2246_04555 [candidate division WOR-1 bacterium RIFOXYA2_FULL_37_7]|uniref:Uncharacterized protein n=1 Tax=candidate division WOR-1 bacterium RIFOXYB2_FULL_37_13 TaxID=1802579 RepID=A0A1F4SQE9_UNCSA|nr:MAG: hypothetical protein A2246_04555 [candidate division WOR-1 bacterium RIFOXYA2_FULL_37_7]OGC22674.1 MAG: hypothetical protein A2310_07955 [candidate division WOR-1 bacterium RIFOXYB2_FULL_37_13]